ncbi:hypothetical protein [Bacillus infantis]|uniref:hypothetical protein n=1 Tax=Bacillus infantis TaxID=324767 RepID=UPI003CED8B5F
MNGIQFGNYHSYDDLSLILSKKEMGSPDIKKNEVDIQGADGVLDYTEYFGDIKYTNRLLKFDFAVINQANFLTHYSNVQDKLHGKKVQIILDEEPGYYYTGRLSVSPYTNEKGIGYISIECDCEPYKKKLTETVVTKAVSGATSIILNNSRQRLVPEITTDATFIIAFGSYSGTFDAGTFRIPELELVEGYNMLTVTGTGNITFRYREGRL